MNTLYYGDNLNILRECIGFRRGNIANCAFKKAGKAGAKGPAQEGLGI